MSSGGDGGHSGPLAALGKAMGAVTGVEQNLSTALNPLADVLPSFPAVRISDMDIGLPHAHMHPPNLIPPDPVPVPLPSTGPVIPIPFFSGATQTVINGLPAARCLDMGLGIWCGGYFPMYQIFLGSSNVWIEGQRAARLGVDITTHCVFSSPRPEDPPLGPMVGFTITGSSNVVIGGVPMPSLTMLAIGAAFRVVGKLLGAGARAALGKLGQRLDEVGDETATKLTDEPKAPEDGEPGGTPESAPESEAPKAGETESTAIGKSAHKEFADARRADGDFDLVQAPITDKAGNPILVPKRVDLKTGMPQPGSPLQEAIPDAVSFPRKLILDDKPLGRPIAKDRQEIIRFIKAYEQREGHLPEVIAITRYDPKTGQQVVTELYKPSDFLP